MLYSGYTAMDKIDELLTRGVANIIPNKAELQKVLSSGKKLNIYLGIDPTATKIHLGHAVPLRKLQAFAEMGHNVTFLIGDFTALIGDTSDKDGERPVLTSQEIETNFQTYKQQAKKILDFSKITVRHNSEWLSDLDFKRVIQLCLQFSLNDFISRELIRRRLDAKSNVGLHEVLYPVMQGYDSYFMDTDMQIGGTDQTFNMQAGRTLQKRWRNKDSFVLATEFLLGTDGKKMSKTGGNAIWLDEKPNDMYAKVMAIHDDLIIPYFTLGTNVSQTTIDHMQKRLADNENPINIKKELAKHIVAELSSEEEAQPSQEYFEKTVQQKELPTEITEMTLHEKEKYEKVNEDLLVRLNLADSKSQAKRLFEQNGVEVDGGKVTEQDKVRIKNNMIIKVGKRKIVRIKLSS